MTILDAFAVIALFRGEPAAERVAGLLVEDPGAGLTPLGVAEVLDHLVRVAGVDVEEAALDVAQLELAEPTAIDGALGAQAGLLRARHYHRRDRVVSMADCVVAAVAMAHGAPVVTADPHLLDLCQEEGIETIALPAP